jgi:hypothetical protein
MSEGWRESILESCGVQLGESQHARENPEDHDNEENKKYEKVKVKAKAKALEGLMQKVSESGAELFDSATGELVPPAKVTYTAPTLALKFPKE